jgi:hypothetical protein
MVVPPTALNQLRGELRKRRQAVAIQNKTVPFAMNDQLLDLIHGAPAIGL